MFMWAHLPILLPWPFAGKPMFGHFPMVNNPHSLNVQITIFWQVTFGPVCILVKSHTYRKWCIRAHRAYAQVGSKKENTNLMSCLFCFFSLDLSTLKGKKQYLEWSDFQSVIQGCSLDQLCVLVIFACRKSSQTYENLRNSTPHSTMSFVWFMN